MSLSEMAGGAVYLALVFVARPAVLVVLALAATFLGSPFRAASAATVPNLVADGDLPWANTQLAATTNAAGSAGRWPAAPSCLSTVPEQCSPSTPPPS